MLHIRTWPFHVMYCVPWLIVCATIQGVTPNERTFRHLLKFSVSKSSIDNYMGVSWKCMTVFVYSPQTHLKRCHLLCRFWQNIWVVCTLERLPIWSNHSTLFSCPHCQRLYQIGKSGYYIHHCEIPQTCFFLTSLLSLFLSPSLSLPYSLPSSPLVCLG